MVEVRGWGSYGASLVSALAAGAGAMAAADIPLVRLGLSDPRRWGTAGWLSDLIPHFAYGVLTACVLRALDRR